MIYESHVPDLDIADYGHYEFIFGDIAEADLDNIAVSEITTGESITYRDLIARIDALAGELADRGVGPGDVVAMQVPNSINFVVVEFAILKLGAAFSAIGMLMNSTDVEKQIKLSGSKLYIGATDIESVEQIFVYELEAICKRGKSAPAAKVAGSETGAIPFSSGTTGLPKGVVLSNRALNAIVQTTCERLIENGLPDSGVPVMIPLPFGHIYGTTVALASALKRRDNVVTLPKFELEPFLKAHGTYDVQMSFIAPPMALVMAKSPEINPTDFEASKLMMCGAAPLDAKVAQAVQDRLGTNVIQGYGMTECVPLVTGLVGKSDLGSVGVLVANSKMRLIDMETGQDVPEGEPGEILMQAPMMMDGYLNNEEATKETITEDGWLHTGDIGRIDEDGSLFIMDRAKEVIKYKGYQVAPAELEAVLVSHPAILDAGVVGVEKDGLEIPRAFVVVAPGAGLDEQAIMDYVASQVTPYKKVRAVELIDAVPKVPNGKIDRNALRKIPFEA